MADAPEFAPMHQGVVILAGGAGRRAGGSKGLLRVQNEAWILRQIRALRAAGVDNVLVVLGHQRERYHRELPELWQHAMVVENEKPEEGPFSSLQAALRAEAGRWDRVFVLPVDVPAAESAVWKALADNLVGEAKACVPCVGGKGGHPVLLRGEWARGFLEIFGDDARLDVQLRRLSPHERINVAVDDERVAMNFNYPADFKAASRLQAADFVGAHASLLALCEVGAGSLLHAFHVPMAGQLLSLNQIFLMSRATRQASERLGAWRSRSVGTEMSAVAAILKSLSPAGKKLTPMLAIAVQGLLFSAGTLLLGANPAGIAMGAVLAGLWAYLQPLLLYYLFFGDTLLKVANYYHSKFLEIGFFPRHTLLYAVIAVVLIKSLLALLTARGGWRISAQGLHAYSGTLLRMAGTRPPEDLAPKATTWRSALRGAVRDLRRPIFILSLILSVLFFVLAENPQAALVWGFLRPLATAFVIFLAVRKLPLERLTRWPALQTALRRLRQFGKSQASDTAF